jgi:PAS domain S-box-containing protein
MPKKKMYAKHPADPGTNMHKQTENTLEQQNLMLVKLNALALGLASLPSSQDIHEFIAKKLKEITGAYAVAFSIYEPDSRVLRTTNIEVDRGILEMVTRILGNKIGDLKYVVTDDIYKQITTEVVGTRHTLTDVTFGEIPPIIGAAIQKLTGVDRFIGVASVIESDLYGASMLVLKTGEPEPATEFLESCANMIAVSLRRRRAEDALRESENKYRELFDSSQDALFVQDIASGSILDVNNTMLTMYGYADKEEVLKCTIEQLSASEEGYNEERIHRMNQEAIDSNSHSFEWRAKKKDGEVFLAQVSLQITRIGREERIMASVRDITEQRRTEEELQKLASVVRYSSELVNLATPDGEMIFLNEAGSRMLGISSAEVEHSNIFQVIPAHLKEKVETELLPAVMEVGTWTGDLQYLNVKTGKLIDVHSMVFIVKDRVTGVPLYLANVSRDITERKQAEKMLSEIVTKNPMSIQILDKDGFTLEVNTSYKRLFGSVPPSDYSLFRDLQLMQLGMGEIFDQLRRGEIVHFPDTYFNAHDSVPEFPDVPAWIRVIGFPLNDSDEKPYKFVLMHENITERKLAEEKLVQSELRFRSVWNNSADGMLLTDREGQILDVNDAFCKLVKAPRAELLGQVFSIAYQTEDPTDDLSIYKKRFDTGETITNLLGSATLRSGEVVHLEVTSSFIEITGHGRMLLSLCRDITQRKRSEEALRQAQKSESIGTLAGGIAHDFNNLLSAILGQSSLALGKLSHENPARNHIDKSIKAAERAADLTRQLLAYSGKGKFVTEEIDLNRLVKENVQLLEVSVSKTTQLRYELCSSALCFHGDIGQIQQVVMNLIINAGEAMGANPGRITVHTNRIELTQNNSEYWKYTNTPLAPGMYALLQVSDNGHGMKPEVLGRIFDPFFTTKFTGRGLGLAAVLGIIRGHGGGVRITSEEGKGTQFEVVFPIVETSTAADAEQAKKALVVDGKGKTVLLIDDEPSVLELLTDIFTEAKFTVIGALNPLEGIELYRQHRASVAMVVLDYSMPGMNGKDAFEELVKINQDVKVLLCSGYTQEETTSLFGDMQPAEFIQKPYQPLALLERVSRVLSEQTRG